jgi:hypothetical protein
MIVRAALRARPPLARTFSVPPPYPVRSVPVLAGVLGGAGPAAGGGGRAVTHTAPTGPERTRLYLPVTAACY